MLDFKQVYDEFKGKVWGLTSRYVFSKQDREDLFQEVFLKIHKALPGFRGDSKIETWIYRITANTAINCLNKQKRYKLLKMVLYKLRFIEAEEMLEPENKTLAKPLEKLNARQRLILIMAEVEEKKLGEIAQLLNIPVGTVKSNLSRAKEIVRKELSNG